MCSNVYEHVRLHLVFLQKKKKKTSSCLTRWKSLGLVLNMTIIYHDQSNEHHTSVTHGMPHY